MQIDPLREAQVVGEDKIDQFSKICQKSAKMAPFAAVAPGGEVRRAIRGARVDEHIRAGYHADAGAREAARRRTRPADTRSFWRHFRRFRAAAATSGENDAQKERASAGLVRLRGASRAPASAWYPARTCSSTRAPRKARRTFPPGATTAKWPFCPFWRVWYHKSEPKSENSARRLENFGGA